VTKNIFVVGATGTQGGAVARALLTSGNDVTGLTRNVDGPGAQRLRELGATMVNGELTDANTLAHVMQGADAVFALTTPFGSSPENEVVQGATLIEAATRAGVGHFVFSSVGSADQATGVPHFESKFRVEQELRESGLRHTVLRPVYFMQNMLSANGQKALREGAFAQPLPANCRLQQMSMKDYAQVVATVVEEPDRFVGRAIDIASDELTGVEQAEGLGRVLDEPVSYLELPFDVLGPEGSDMRLMFEWFAKVGYRADIAGLRSMFPNIHWQSFEDWAREEGRESLLGP
jgi:uncharacterized protein YbjT (DUF2867 family)